MPTLYGIPNCDTVKKARTALEAHGIPYVFHDFKKLGLPEDRLDAWINHAGWETLLNRRGTTWRQLTETARDAVTDARSARELMLALPSIIKRPVVEWDDGSVTIGFDTQQWQTRLPG